MEQISIDRRFVGPPGMAHGGYLGGRLAALLSDAPAAEVRLRAPTPLETPLAVERPDASSLRLLADGEPCAECRPCEFDLEIVPLVSYEDAERAGADAFQWVMDRLSAQTRRYFVEIDEQERCFGCMPRSGGLSLLPGRVGSSDVTAVAVRVPPDLLVDNTVPAEIVWSTVDCPAMWACKLLAEDEEGLERPTFTGTLSVKIHRLPRAEERLFVQAWRLGQEGRKLFGAAILVRDDGEILAESRQTAIVS